MKRSGKKSVEKSRQESHKQTSSQEFLQKQASKRNRTLRFGSRKLKNKRRNEESQLPVPVIKTQKQTSKRNPQLRFQFCKTRKTNVETGESAASESQLRFRLSAQKQTSKQESAASGSGSIKTQKQTSIPEASEDNGPFRLVVPSSLYSQQSMMVPPIRNVTVHRKLTPITRTTEPYRSNVRIAEPSNWTRDVNETYDLREENAYLRGRIDELNRQLDNANGELRDLWLDVGQLQSYNNILSQENDGLHHRHSSDLQDIEFEEDQ
ncbi:uncharacterized protein OCT59_010012 [Rhizophagus irregularis]|uniref:uncharacterized protein n=1 Tax=Rhizophagus irregularis TaxID=588596 RepID=UPI0033306F80|nr:hypothetical protein OCT59_010012 [Rhizophagus irregularis]